MDLGEPARPFWICANIPVGGGIEISMLPPLIASEDDAGHLASGQFMHPSIRDRELLVSGTYFAPQSSSPSHLILLS
jgi:hypothetical protein